MRTAQQSFRNGLSNPRGFTIVEAMVALTITAIASSAILLGIQSSIQTTNHALEQTIANGMAQQLMDEIMGHPYVKDGGDPYDTSLGPEGGETSREDYDDIGDFNGYSSQPPTDRFGIELGIDNGIDGIGGKRHPNFYAESNFFDNWGQKVSVYYVSSSDTTVPLPGAQTSDYRAVEVTIVNGNRELIKLSRVVTYVSPP